MRLYLWILLSCNLDRCSREMFQFSLLYGLAEHVLIDLEPSWRTSRNTLFCRYNSIDYLIRKKKYLHPRLHMSERDRKCSNRGLKDSCFWVIQEEYMHHEALILEWCPVEGTAGLSYGKGRLGTGPSSTIPRRPQNCCIRSPMSQWGGCWPQWSPWTFSCCRAS